MRLITIALVTVLTLSGPSSAATTEQLRQWILASRKSIPSDGADGDLTGTILRLLGFGNDKETTTAAIVKETTALPTTTTVEPTTTNRDVCPFGAEPLLLASDFAYCRPSSIGDCPVGYLCDQSFVLGRSICCKDSRPNQGGQPRPIGRPASSVRPPFSWNTVTPTQAPKWVGLPGSTKKAPWYIKDRTNWPTVYNRLGETTTELTITSTTTEQPTTTTPTTTTTTTQAPTTTRANPWARLWTSTLPPRNNVNVSVLQAGSIRPLRDGQVEAVGAITLVNDNGYLVLIDTGASSDTERLLQIRSISAIQMVKCCTAKRARTVGTVLGFLDTVFLSLVFFKTVHILQEYGFNLLATSAVSCVGVLYALHLCCIASSWVGFAQEKSAFIIPKLVLKATTVLGCYGLTFLLVYFCLSESYFLGDIIAKGFNTEYHHAKEIVDAHAATAAGVGAGATLIQSCLFVILYNCYNTIREKEVNDMLQKHLKSLAKEQVTLDQITTVVITHGHPGHMGNLNFFAQKPILYHSMEYIGRHVTPTELKERPYRKLSTNIEVWKTPGHTQHDLTVLVHNVAGYGTMAIAGDLIPSEALVADKRDVMSDEGVWDAAIKRQNANLIICMADWIVPGHGQPFRVLPHYRQKAGCTRLLAQRHMLNQA